MRMWLSSFDMDGIITISAQGSRGKLLGTASARIGQLLDKKGPVSIPCDHGHNGASASVIDHIVSHTACMLD